ncbi:BMC domain-containing protein [Yersinia enterocolitica]
MINSLGLLEVYGLVPGIDAADAMLKSADVRILNYELVEPALVTLVIEGDLAACRAALDAGIAAASRTGKVISHKVIGRPDGDTEWLITGFSGVPVKVKPSPAPVSTPEPVSVPEPIVVAEPVPVVEPAPVTAEVSVAALDTETLVAYVASASHRHGVTAGEASMHFSLSLEECRDALEALFEQGKLRKRGSRYRLIQEENLDE